MKIVTSIAVLIVAVVACPIAITVAEPVGSVFNGGRTRVLRGIVLLDT